MTLDAGALLAIERGDRRLSALLKITLAEDAPIYVPAGVVAQVWRGGSRQARLARLMADSAVTVVPLDEAAARAAGTLCAHARTRDVVDASVVWCARTHGSTPIITSDPEDLTRLDPRARVVPI